MTNNINEVFTAFTQSINNNVQAINENTRALQMAYQQAIQAMSQAPEPQPVVRPVTESFNQDELVNQLVQQQVSALMPGLIQQAVSAVSQVNQVPTPVMPVAPVVEEAVANPSVFVPTSEQYKMTISIKKPCASCPFKDECQLRPSQISEQCNVAEMKNAALAAGEIHVQVKLDPKTYEYSFKAFKDGVFIGNLHLTNKEAKDLRNQLENYEGHTVRFMTHLYSDVGALTNLHAEILGLVEEPETISTKTATVVVEEVIEFPGSLDFPDESSFLDIPEEPQEPIESATIDFGEMVLPI